MEITFPYKHYEKVSPAIVPDANLMGIYAPRSVGQTDTQTILSKAIAHPIGCQPLRELVKKRDRVLILIDDYTRGTPLPKVLPHVLDELKKAGVSGKAITFLTAQGTHRHMTEQESGQIKDVVGASILADVCQVIDKTDCILVSPGVTFEEAKRLGLRYAQSVQDALEMAFEKQGKKARVAVLRQGGHILPAAAA